MSELSEATKLLGHGSISERNSLEAMRLLSQRNFDARKLSEDVNSVVVKVVWLIVIVIVIIINQTDVD